MSIRFTRGVVVALLVLFNVFSAGNASAPAYENLIENASFEAVNEQGRPWPHSLAVYEGSAKVTIDSGQARTGQNSVRIEGDGKSRGLFTTGVSVEGGKAYRVSLWYRTDETIELGTVRLRLMAYHQPQTSDDNKVPWQFDWLLDPYEGDFQIEGPNFYALNWQTAVDQWRLLTVSFRLPDAVVALRVEGFNWRGNGIVWFDDVSLVEID